MARQSDSYAGSLHDRLLPELERRAVELARADGWNWAIIAAVLGRSRQGLRKQYGSIQRGETRPLRATDETRRLDRERQRERAAVRWQQVIEEAERRRAEVSGDTSKTRDPGDEP